ncbi:MAG: hypothetical protein WAT19_03190 [Ferruginibacter sp.]
MDDQFVKYGKLSGAIFLLFLGFLLVFAFIILAVRLLFGLFNYIPWASYIFMIFIVAAPALLFISVFTIFFKRTLSHPSALAKYFSLAVFAVALLLWVYTLGTDMILFSKKYYTNAAKYNSYQFWMLVGSVLTIFFTGMIQALTTEKEKDWLQKRREKEGLNG